MDLVSSLYLSSSHLVRREKGVVDSLSVKEFLSPGKEPSLPLPPPVEHAPPRGEVVPPLPWP